MEKKIGFRLSQVDLLRALAVIMVLFRHHAFYYPLQYIGWAGVDLFFVLSGFLVTSLIFREYAITGDFSIKTFLIRRGFKIYPLFYFFIILSLLFILLATQLTGYSKPDLGSKILAEIFFFQNYKEGLWGHTWSLAVEEHFYLVISIFIFLVIRYWPEGFKKIPAFFLIFIGVIIAVRFVNISLNPDIDYRTHVYPTHLRLDSLMFGSLLAYLFIFKNSQLSQFVTRYKFLLLTAAIVVLGITLSHDLFSGFLLTTGFTLLYLAFGVLLLLAVFFPADSLRKLEGNLLYRRICSIGKYSYAIYLFHMFLPSIFDNVDYFREMNVYVRFLIYFVASISAGILVSKIIEYPILYYRDSLYPRKTAQVL